MKLRYTVNCKVEIRFYLQQVKRQSKNLIKSNSNNVKFAIGGEVNDIESFELPEIGDHFYTIYIKFGDLFFDFGLILARCVPSR